jgi:RHS repeat-associated protein
LAFAGKVGKIQLVYWVGSEGRLAGTPGTNGAPGPFPTDYLSPVIAGMAREDGYQIEDLTIQGVRSYDPDTAQWTTPDAYSGDVHDPMSQKPFMWNNNNPVSYSDPSGYVPENLQEAILTALVGPIPITVRDASRVAQKMIDPKATEEDKGIAGLTAASFFLGPEIGLPAAEGLSAAEMFGFLREAATRPGNWGDLSATAAESNAMGEAFVGPGARPTGDGLGLISENGMRRYRFPTWKEGEQKVQSNFEWRSKPKGSWSGPGTGNAHLVVRDKK